MNMLRKQPSPQEIRSFGDDSGAVHHSIPDPSDLGSLTFSSSCRISASWCTSPALLCLHLDLLWQTIAQKQTWFYLQPAAPKVYTYAYKPHIYSKTHWPSWGAAPAQQISHPEQRGSRLGLLDNPCEMQNTVLISNESLNKETRKLDMCANICAHNIDICIYILSVGMC